LSPLTGHAFLERRYLIIPGLRSSRIYIVDTKPDPTKAKIHKIIEPEEVFKKTGYSRPHTVHCGPEGIYVSTLGGGGKEGTNGPPGVFIMDCETFDILGRTDSATARLAQRLVADALHEETLIDHRVGRIMNANIAEYHVPVNADIHDIRVIFVDEPDDSNPIGIKGLGEIGIVGVAAA
jgi:hypothetical protein